MLEAIGWLALGLGLTAVVLILTVKFMRYLMRS